MTQNVLIISHADADGHLIAEQTRRNLDLVPGFQVSTLIDPERTKDHRVWLKLNELTPIETSDFVFFVDLMFAPETFVEEAAALVDFVDSRPTKKFFLVDHHPLPYDRLSFGSNLHVVYRPNVFECAFGPPSGMMVVAALCEKQASNVSSLKQPWHETLALGMNRAAALGGTLPGEKLLALLRFDQWNAIELLGSESKELHRLPRGRRPKDQPFSKALELLDDTANSLLSDNSNPANQSTKRQNRRETMPYDFEPTNGQNIAQERFDAKVEPVYRTRNSRVHATDLEAIVTLMEVAALSLTTAPDSTFSVDQLLAEVRNLGGDEIAVEERDIKIVLEKARFLEKVSGELRLK